MRYCGALGYTLNILSAQSTLEAWELSGDLCLSVLPFVGRSGVEEGRVNRFEPLPETRFRHEAITFFGLFLALTNKRLKSERFSEEITSFSPRTVLTSHCLVRTTHLWLCSIEVLGLKKRSLGGRAWNRAAGDGLWKQCSYGGC